MLINISVFLPFWSMPLILCLQCWGLPQGPHRAGQVLYHWTLGQVFLFFIICKTKTALVKSGAHTYLVLANVLSTLHKLELSEKRQACGAHLDWWWMWESPFRCRLWDWAGGAVLYKKAGWASPGEQVSKKCSSVGSASVSVFRVPDMAFLSGGV